MLVTTLFVNLMALTYFHLSVVGITSYIETFCIMQDRHVCNSPLKGNVY